MATKPPAVELEVEGRVVRLSNPDRVYFPARGETKLDLANYYLAVGPGIVNALFGRPCMLHRYPKGISADQVASAHEAAQGKVHQKRIPAGAPEWVETVRLHFPRYDRYADELCVTELASVVWAVQMSTVEFHPWNSRRPHLEEPDEWRIDLDPGPECSYQRVRDVAGCVREVLEELGITGYPKTSGGAGLHIYVRIRPSWSFGDVRRAALAFSREVERRMPWAVTTAWWRKDRDPGAVFIDYNQNARDHTIAAAYSVRGNPLGTVSAPLTWAEIDIAEPEDFTIASMPARFDDVGDLHKPMDAEAFGLGRLLEWADLQAETDEPH